MKAVVNRVHMREPLDAASIAAAKRHVGDRAPDIDGLISLHLLQAGDDLVVVVLGEDEQALERTRQDIGNFVMSEFVLPHAAGAPDRRIAEVLVSYHEGAPE